MEAASPKLLQLVATLANAQTLVIAAVLGALAGRALRSLLLLLIDRGRGKLRVALRLLTALAYGALGVGYGLLCAAMLRWDRTAVLVASAAAASMLIGVLVMHVMLRRPLRISLLGVLARATLILALLLLCALTLMRSGFLALTTDVPLLRIELTGETRPQTVRWMAPDQPLQEQALPTHRILLRRPDPPQGGHEVGAIVGEAWLYGDQVAVKGRVLRLSPLLNVAGIANLFELQFIHNGYFTAERHNAYPHHAEPLQPLGPLVVHPRWRPLRDYLLARWERASDGKERAWIIRAATNESTYFSLVDAQGKPLHHTYELVLTPGGLTSR